MKKILTFLISAVTFLSCSSFTENAQLTRFNQQQEIIINKSNENFKSLKWVNSGTINSKSKDLFDKYSINYESAKDSNCIYIQEERLSFEEKVPVYILNDKDIKSSLLNYKDDEYVHNKGYIRFIIKAYDYGYYDSHVIYKIELTTEQEKSFFINHNDVIIIQHGDNAITFDENYKKAKGTRIVPFDYKPNGGNSFSRREEVVEIQPNYSCAEGGIYYEFQAQDLMYGYGDAEVKSYRTTINTEYYLVATDTTSIQPTYVHNFNPLELSLSVNFGPIGVGINIPTWYNDPMDGKVMNLPGYNDRVNTEVINVKKADFGFEPQYFFYDKSKNIPMDNITIKTERLRCGYIEEEYIVLSLNRINAGNSYLSLNFDKKIYEIETSLTFWSANEYISKSNGDSAYIQYKDENDEWINLVDLLKANLPTDRTQPKEFTLIIPEGTHDIRFIAKSKDPKGDRNKGRICIDDLKLVSYERK